VLKENCELLARAQSLAIKRGLDVSRVVCPFSDVCKGERCHLFNADEPNENQEIAESLRNYDRKISYQLQRRRKRS
jgi:hypothetical protein